MKKPTMRDGDIRPAEPHFTAAEWIRWFSDVADYIDFRVEVATAPDPESLAALRGWRETGKVDTGNSNLAWHWLKQRGVK